MLGKFRVIEINEPDGAWKRESRGIKLLTCLGVPNE